MKNTPCTSSPQAATGVLLATLLLPGLAALSALAPVNASAESAPEKTTIALKYGYYSDSQPGWDRIKVNAGQVYFQAPVAGEWSIEGSGVGDSVSGATPRMHTDKSSATPRMSDERKAGDLKVTRYFSRAAVSASVAYSSEHDYVSRAVGLDARWSSDDNNRTWSVGMGGSSDDIDNTASGGSVVNKHKNTQELMGGITQVLTPADIAQFNLTRSTGQGYFDDPYKTLDKRPDQRDAWIALARWNHYMEPFKASLRTSYRYYSDTFGINAHTFGVDWVQPVGQWTFTPGVRYYSQSAASFYQEALVNAQGQYDVAAVMARSFALYGGNQSTDQRLAAFGAITLSIKAAYALTPDTSVDIKFENYRQTAGLHLGGSGSANLDPFSANFIQVGLTHRF